MNNITLEDLIKLVKLYDNNSINKINKAYNLAKINHEGQLRDSGEEYIIHPLYVAYYLAKYKADSNMICAALLHDTLEDTKLTKDDIVRELNEDIAYLVEGVTKLSLEGFSNKKEQEDAYKRRLIKSITEDVRVIMIKLADRLHNMQTLEYKSKESQLRNSYETLKIFAPIAYNLGAYKIKMELEDLSMKYIKPSDYQRIYEDRLMLIDNTKDMFLDMQLNINDKLKENGINAQYKTDIKHVYSIYKELSKGNDLFKIYDLFGLKILVNNYEECYKTLGLTHFVYRPLNEKIRDYIANPKPNLYRSLNTAVFYSSGRIVQARIRTPQLDIVDQEGLIAYYNEQRKYQDITMQKCFEDKIRFCENISEIDTDYKDNEAFLDQVYVELLSDHVNVYTDSGKLIQLPKGSTLVDFAYKIHSDVGNNMIGAQVNGENVPFNYVLNEKDRVRILVDKESLGPNEKWLDLTHTTSARRRIKEYLKK